MSAVARLYFDIESIEKDFKEINGEDAILDILEFKIFESSSRDGTFTEIDTQDFDPRKNFIETKVATALDFWFKFKYVDSLAVVSEFSTAILAESIEILIKRIRKHLGDTDENLSAFTDEEYIDMIRNANARMTDNNNVTLLSEWRIQGIALLSRIQACYTLAYRNSDKFPVELPDDVKIDTGKRVDHYVKLAKALEGQWKEMKKDLGSVDDEGELTGIPKIDSQNWIRESYFTDQRRIGTNRYGDGLGRSRRVI